MPRPQRAQGRPGTHVIPTDWSSSHAPAVTSTLLDTCTITHTRPRAGTAAFDRTSGTYSGNTPLPHYTGPCRLNDITLSAGTDPVAGDEVIPESTYTLVVPRGAAPATLVDDTVTMADGHRLTVRRIASATEEFDQVFYCTDNQSTGVS